MAEDSQYLRKDGRRAGELRPTIIHTGVNKQAEGAALIEAGDTRVLCTASVESKVPPFLNGTQKGWVTAEYGMLPRATSTRTPREASRGKLTGRTMEIQRLVGRALRAVVDPVQLGARTIWLDCDVLQADGGTRTASITGAFVALSLAVARLLKNGDITASPLKEPVAATSIGIIDGRVLLDLNYDEDSAAGVDMNVVMTGAGRLVEVQGTGEHDTFDLEQLNSMLAMARQGIFELHRLQLQAIDKAVGIPSVLPTCSCALPKLENQESTSLLKPTAEALRHRGKK
jgi:ribonuclease PH